jgi:hypothetical protein
MLVTDVYVGFFPLFDTLGQPHDVFEIWMCPPAWYSTASAVQAAHVPSPLRRTLATLPCRLGRGATSARVSEPLSKVHGLPYFSSPAPPMADVAHNSLYAFVDGHALHTHRLLRLGLGQGLVTNAALRTFRR